MKKMILLGLAYLAILLVILTMNLAVIAVAVRFLQWLGVLR